MFTSDSFTLKKKLFSLQLYIRTITRTHTIGSELQVRPDLSGINSSRFIYATRSLCAKIPDLLKSVLLPVTKL